MKTRIFAWIVSLALAAMVPASAWAAKAPQMSMGTVQDVKDHQIQVQLHNRAQTQTFTYDDTTRFEQNGTGTEPTSLGKGQDVTIYYQPAGKTMKAEKIIITCPEKAP